MAKGNTTSRPELPMALPHPCVTLMGYRGPYRKRRARMLPTCSICRGLIKGEALDGDTCSDRCRLSFRSRKRGRMGTP